MGTGEGLMLPAVLERYPELQRRRRVDFEAKPGSLGFFLVDVIKAPLYPTFDLVAYWRMAIDVNRDRLPDGGLHVRVIP
jgi:hypothetical protein